ncbi:hypothetical protein FA15DRAFT_422148 [Coprinopsis marcescibilis]|uniref:Uncharacterized protein n=1 Tax=Coprinopsis marcescibilis TaxID=230819 RepID=A0A5C3KVP5_COPMA|nr:hypothetical protein FA15DRAFT_422148 [Coprinopsis marcescibilis]
MHSSALHFYPARAASTHSERDVRRPPPRTGSTSSATATTLGSTARKLLSDEVVDDKHSFKSNSTTQASQGTRAAEALRGITGDRVRHAKCPPEFLEAIAVRHDKQVKIVTGSEASTFFVKYLGGYDSNKSSMSESKAIVFAVTVWERGRKCVDYYMTWRGKTNAQKLKDDEVKQIDDEFRRVSRRIDRDYKVFRKAGSVASSISTRSTSSRKRSRSRSPAVPKKNRPEPIPVPRQDAPAEPLDLKLPEPPVSAADSVISLPYLTMVPGVPRGNRLALFLTNPDRLSTYSELSDVSAETLKQAANGASPFVLAITPPDNTAPDPEQKAFIPEASGLTPIMKSSASIFSTETRSSKSSQSSADSQSTANNSPDYDYADPNKPLIEFLIVLLGDKLDKEGLSWHGLERQFSARSQNRVFTKERNSPWIGPLARPDPSAHTKSRKNKHVAPGNESDSDGIYEERDWKDAPVVPLQPLLESMGMMGSMNHHPHHTPVIPLGMPPYPGSVVSSPVPPNEQQLRYSTYSASAGPTMVGSPYAPPWMGLSANNSGSPAASHPPSRAASTLGGYGSPYMQRAY